MLPGLTWVPAFAGMTVMALTGTAVMALAGMTVMALTGTAVMALAGMTVPVSAEMTLTRV